MALETQARCGAAEYGNVARANFAQIETRLAALELTSDVAYETVAALKALASPTAVTVVTVEGYYAAGDGGGGSFVWSPTSTATDNGGTVLTPAAAPSQGRWLRLYEDFVDVRWFGAQAGGGDCVTAIEAAIACGARSVFFPAGIFTVSRGFATGTGIKLFGVPIDTQSYSNMSRVKLSTAASFLLKVIGFNVRIENLWLDGAKKADNTVYLPGTSTGGAYSHDVRFDSCVVSGAYRDATNALDGNLIAWGGNWQADWTVFKQCHITQDPADATAFARRGVMIYGNTNAVQNTMEDSYIGNADRLVLLIGGSLNLINVGFGPCVTDAVATEGTQSCIERCYTEYPNVPFLNMLNTTGQSAEDTLILRQNKLNAVGIAMNLNSVQPVVLEHNKMSDSVAVAVATLSAGFAHHRVTAIENVFTNTAGFGGAGYPANVDEIGTIHVTTATGAYFAETRFVEPLKRVRVATTSPVTVDPVTDQVIVTLLDTPGAVAVNLPAVTDCRVGLEIVIWDGTGDANLNNITISAATDTDIDGGSSTVINSAGSSVKLLCWRNTGHAQWTIKAK